MKSACVIIFCAFLTPSAFPLPGDADRDTTLPRPTVTAHRSQGPISIDDILDEPGWNQVPISNFTQKNPTEGAPPTFTSEVWVLYDDEAIYIGAKLHDASPASIVVRSPL